MAGSEARTGADGAAGMRTTIASRLTRHARDPLFANAYALVANTGVTALLGFAYWVTAARTYAAASVGAAAAAISAMSLLAGLAQFNLEAVMVRFVPVAGRRTRRLVAAVYVFCAAAAAIAAAAFLVGLDLWAPTLGFLRDGGWGPWFVVATVAWVIFVLQDGILVGLGKAIVIPVENAAYGVTKLALLLALVGGGPLALFASWTVPVALVVVPTSALIFARFLPRHEQTAGEAAPPDIRTVVRYAGADYAGAMLELGTVSLLPLLVLQRAGPAENAYFYQCWIIAYTLILVANNTTRSLTVQAARDPNRLQADARRLLRQTLWLLLPAALALVVLAPVLLSVFGEAYAAAGTVQLRLLALASIPHAIVLIGLVTARIGHRLREVVAIQGATAAVALGGAVLLVGPSGGVGVATAWLIAQTAVAAVLLATRLSWLWRPRQPPEPARAAIR